MKKCEHTLPTENQLLWCDKKSLVRPVGEIFALQGIQKGNHVEGSECDRSERDVSTESVSGTSPQTRTAHSCAFLRYVPDPLPVVARK